MLLERNYRINHLTGSILTREKVYIQCDNCEKIWSTIYCSYKRKKLDKDYCRSCKNSLGICGVKGGHSETTRAIWKDKGVVKTKQSEIKCDHCDAFFFRHNDQIGKRNFCSTKCRHLADYQNKYKIIEEKMKMNLDDVSYLFGAILGDGGITKSSNRTRRIVICSNMQDDNSVKNILSAAKENNIITNNTIRKKYHVNLISFTLPKSILKYYNLDFVGDKYKAQPIPNKKIMYNINFLVGLINSDGYYAQRKYSRYIQFTNTVRSIVDSFTNCLKFHNIKYRHSIFNSKNDREKIRHDIFIHGLSNIEKIINKSKYRLKKRRLIK